MKNHIKTRLELHEEVFLENGKRFIVVSVANNEGERCVIARVQSKHPWNAFRAAAVRLSFLMGDAQHLETQPSFEENKVRLLAHNDPLDTRP